MDTAKTLASLLAAILLIRMAVVGVIDVVLSSIMKEQSAATLLGGLGWVVAASVASAAASFVWRDVGPGARRLGAALAGLGVVAFCAYQDQVVHRGWFDARRGVTRDGPAYPLVPGTVYQDLRGGRPTKAVIGPDGTRPCGSGDEGPVVLVVGDSFAFGSGLHDEETLCWQLREALGAQGLTVRTVNYGQAGASIVSTEAALREGIARLRPAAVWFTVLPGDDARAFDMNDQGGLVDNPAFRAASAILEPDVLWLAMALFYEVSPPDPWDEVVARRGLRRVADAATAAGVPLVLDVLVFDQPRLARAYLAAQARLAEASSWVFAPPMIVFSENFDEDPPLIIAGDGHLTALGNARRVANVLPSVVAALARSGAE